MDQHLPEVRCQALGYAQDLRGEAIAKNTNHEPEDDQFLFTLKAIKTVLGKEEAIQALLKCACKTCQKYKLKEDHIRPNTSESFQYEDEQLRGIAVLVLSHCIYALRSFLQSTYRNLPEYVARLCTDDEAGVDLCEGLFRPCMQFDGKANDEAHMRSLRDQVARQIRAKMWLVEIPHFRANNSSSTRKVSRNHNLPIIDEEATQKWTGPHKTFTKFRIADGYVTPPELSKALLFRKQFVIQNNPKTEQQIQNARAEIRSLSVVNKTAPHPNIIRQLFAFEDDRDNKNHTNGAPPHRISIVFLYHEYDLENVLTGGNYQDIFPHFRNAPPPKVEFQHVLGHGIWCAMLGIIDAVQKLHSLAEDTWMGHFDIKPKNIMIEFGQRPSNTAKLLLADFGSAVEGSRREEQTTQVDIKSVTIEYSPPEYNETNKARRIHDKWSLGCILIEILVLLTESRYELIQFRNNRENKSGSGRFWCKDEDGQSILCEPVKDKLAMLAKQEALQLTVKHIEQMLSVDQEERKKCDLAACVRAFTPPRWEVRWLNLEDGTTTNCSIDVSSQTGQIQLRIKMPNGHSLEPILAKPDSAYFSPSWLLQESSAEQDELDTNYYECSLQPLENSRRTVLQFATRKGACDYMRQTTRQEVAELPPELAARRESIGLNIRFKRCTSKIHSHGWQTARLERGAGRVQLWAKQSIAGYQKGHDYMQSRFKLALFFFKSNVGNSADIGAKAIWIFQLTDNTVRTKRAREANKIKFTASRAAKRFHVAEYERVSGEASSPSSWRGGFPLCPQKLDASIKDSKLILQDLELELEEGQARHLRDLIQHYHL